tara:strand:+ start:63 stop:239 length:177 start_codon:yes stop_codon:yes gene_type:complete
MDDRAKMKYRVKLKDESGNFSNKIITINLRGKYWVQPYLSEMVHKEYPNTTVEKYWKV